MNRLYFLATLLILCVTCASAQQSRAMTGDSEVTALPPPTPEIILTILIKDVEAGSLPDRVAAFDDIEIQGVKITGQLNGTDINCLRDMANGKLKYLDISECDIVEGGDNYSQGTVNTETAYNYWRGGYIILVKPRTEDNIIGRGMFASLSALETIKLPNTVTTIEASALRDCPNLKSVTIGPEVNNLSSCCVFTGCTNLTSVTFTNNNDYTIIDKIIYTSDCQTVVMALPTAEGSVSLLNTVKKVASYAFYDLQNVTNVTLPEGIDEIGAYAFYNTGISELNLPLSTNRINDGAFWKCTNLSAVDFPESLETIGYGSFAGCNLSEIDLSNTHLTTILGNETSHSNNIYPGWRVTSYSAFQGNPVTKVSLPSTLQSIGRNAFVSENLTDIYSYAIVPPTMYFVHYIPPVEISENPSDNPILVVPQIGGSTYSYQSSLTNVDTLTCRVHVPAVALADYRVAHGWRAFLSNMVADLPDDIGYEPYEGSGDDLQDYLNSFDDTEDVLTETAYTRQFRNTEWQSLYVPFTLNYSDWSACFEVARLTGASKTDGNTQIEATLLTADDGDLLANTPYLIRAKKTGKYTISFDASQMSEQKENTQTLDNLLVIKGNYNQRTSLKSSGFRCMLGGSLWYPTTDDYVLPPFRWYAYPYRLRIVRNSPIQVVIRDGATTGISAKADVGGQDGRYMVYDLQGRRVDTDDLSRLPKGIYIINGKKCTVK